MEKISSKFLNGYQEFRKKYAADDQSTMRYLSDDGQKPEILVVACSDSRVDPALILQCDPGDLFVIRNVASIVPAYEKNGTHPSIGAALEFGVRFLKVKHLIILGHSQCGGIQALLDQNKGKSNKNDFIDKWVSIMKTDNMEAYDVDSYVKESLNKSYDNCLTFPWIQEKVTQEELTIHRWFFEIKNGKIFAYSKEHNAYLALS